MKTIKLLAVLFTASLIFTSCSDDDENPEIVNEEEEITTVNITLTPVTGDAVVIMAVDLDGEAGADPVEITGGTLLANTTYTGSIELLNEMETPVEDVTLEIQEEDDVHQFFFFSDADFSFEYLDEDENGLPVGLNFSLTTGDVGSTNFSIELYHELDKEAPGVSDGDATNAVGLELEATFPITVEENTVIGGIIDGLEELIPDDLTELIPGI